MRTTDMVLAGTVAAYYFISSSTQSANDVPGAPTSQDMPLGFNPWRAVIMADLCFQGAAIFG